MAVNPGKSVWRTVGIPYTILSVGICRSGPALFIGFPGDEDLYGGCLAAGRGFLHVSPSGDLEPCPAAPYSDANLTSVPLKEALGSRLLLRIRNEHGLLTESTGGCALRANRAWVQELLGQKDRPATP